MILRLIGKLYNSSARVNNAVEVGDYIMQTSIVDQNVLFFPNDLCKMLRVTWFIRFLVLSDSPKPDNEKLIN